jgi:CheY-like chemotaxis protein
MSPHSRNSTTAATLARLGYGTVEAQDATEALRIATEAHADLVLTDVVMPGMNGWDLVRETIC